MTLQAGWLAKAISSLPTSLDTVVEGSVSTTLYSLAVLTLILWLLAEVIFYIWYCHALAKAQNLVPPPIVSLEDREWLLNRILSHAEDYGVWRQVQGWFLTKDCDAMCSPHEVGHDELLELLAWAFFYKKPEDLDTGEETWINFARGKIATDFHIREMRLGRGGASTVRHTLDNVRAIHRPLLFYVGIHILYWLHGLFLCARGFRRGYYQGLWYWYRLQKQQSQPQDVGHQQGTGSEPVAFFHGIGLGLLLYLPLLVRLQAREQFLFEMPWIAMNPFARIPSSTEYAQWVKEVLELHKVPQCVAVGHSFGSLPVAWLIRQHPGQISRCVLVDPVAIFLNLPDVCVNFLYKNPKTLNGTLMRVFGAREFGIAKTLMRHFFWTDNVLFPEMLPPGSSVILGEKDRILPVKDIYTSAAKLPKLRTVVMKDLDHGHFLMKPSAITTIVDHVEQPQTQDYL